MTNPRNRVNVRGSLYSLAVNEVCVFEKCDTRIDYVRVAASLLKANYPGRDYTVTTDEGLIKVMRLK